MNIRTRLLTPIILVLWSVYPVFADPLPESQSVLTLGSGESLPLTIAAVTCSCQTKYGTCSAVQTSCEGGLVEGCACFSKQGSLEFDLEIRLAFLQRGTSFYPMTSVQD